MAYAKILHCADIHIGATLSFLGEKANQRRYETLLTFEKIVDIADENNVQLVAMAGDIFDSNSVEPAFFDAFFSKIASVPHIKFVFAAGNHDPLDIRSPFRKKCPDNIYILNTRDDMIKFDDLSLCVYGRSFESAFLEGEQTFSLSPHKDYVNLMVMHGDLRSDTGGEYNGITPNFIKNSGMDYIALGHIHKRSEISKLGETFFAYSGCPEGQGFDESGEKGVYIGEIGKGLCELKFLPVARRLHICEEIDISGMENSIEISDKILSVISQKYGENFAEHLYKITLVGETSPEGIAIDEIRSRLADKVYFIKLRDNTEPTVDLATLSAEASLKGIFVKNMLSLIENAPKEEKASYKYALKIGLSAFADEVKYNED